MVRKRLELKEKSRDATRVLVIIVLIFLVCNFWGFVTTLLERIYGVMTLVEKVPRFYTFSREAINFLAIINSSINFIIYCIFGKDFRKELIIVYGCRSGFTLVLPVEDKFAPWRSFRLRGKRFQSLRHRTIQTRAQSAPNSMMKISPLAEARNSYSTNKLSAMDGAKHRARHSYCEDSLSSLHDSSSGGGKNCNPDVWRQRDLPDSGKSGSKKSGRRKPRGWRPFQSSQPQPAEMLGVPPWRQNRSVTPPRLAVNGDAEAVKWGLPESGTLTEIQSQPRDSPIYGDSPTITRETIDEEAGSLACEQMTPLLSLEAVREEGDGCSGPPSRQCSSAANGRSSSGSRNGAASWPRPTTGVSPITPARFSARFRSIDATTTDDDDAASLGANSNLSNDSNKVIWL